MLLCVRITELHSKCLSFPAGVAIFDLKHWHGIPLARHLQLYADAAKAGYAVLTMSQYGTHAVPLYAVVMIKRVNNPEQKAFWKKTRDEFQSIFDDQVRVGWGPVILTACGEVDSASFAGIWEKKDPIPLTRLLLTDSPRRYDPCPPPWNYPEGAWTLKIDCQGTIDIRDRRWRIGKTLAGERVLIQPVQERYLIYYCNTLVRELDTAMKRSTIVQRFIETQKPSNNT